MKELEKVALSKRRKMELARFLKRLKKELNVEEVYLFGSRVYGIPLRESDLDMVVVSEEFGKRSFVENLMLLSGMWDGSFTLELFPYTPSQIKEYRDRKIVVHEAVNKGLRIKLV
ncbi:MAG: nucleotidyltransferase domain-containing protein [Candidatus Caldarchaeum sp.]|nr:nucleotidyltransferase domain-containing protein [Candidatus Caldarchaeum sp.]MCX8201485.1 nucleotidyltransferase domain-containing protein [Candidatus Caldarchaeum sp.]MDW8434596.1 nucleotidyltransferase domain-containing protein [Candidatus Caldarchaeum sp.]